MNTEKAFARKFVWPLSIEQIHQDCREWLSEIACCKSRLRYYEKSLRFFLAHPFYEKEGRQLTQLFNQLQLELYPQIQTLERRIRRLQRCLAKVARGQQLEDGRKHAHNRYLYQRLKENRQQLEAFRRTLYELLAESMKRHSRLETRGIWTHRPKTLLRRSG
jgi:exonuclease VII large subunit